MAMLIGGSGRPGPRRRRPDRPGPGDHRRHHPAARARQVPGHVRRRVRRLQRRRPAARRVLHRRTRLALDLLAEHPDRPRRPVHHVPRAAMPAGRAATTRIDYLGAAVVVGFGDVAAALHVVGRSRLRLDRSAEPRAARSGGLLLAVVFRARRAARRGADHPHAPVPRAGVPLVGRCSPRSWAWRCSAAIIYLPFYLQVVKGYTPTQSGLALLPMVVGIFLTSIGSGLLVTRYRSLPDLPDHRRGHHRC